MRPMTERTLIATTGRSGGHCRGARGASSLPRTGGSVVSGTPMGEDA